MCNIIISHARAAMFISICHVPLFKHREERKHTDEKEMQLILAIREHYLSYSRKVGGDLWLHLLLQLMLSSRLTIAELKCLV